MDGTGTVGTPAPAPGATPVATAPAAGPIRRTKWHYLTDAEKTAIDLWPIGTPDHPCKCSGCGELLRTEGAFARHFIVPDPSYLNLGYCPVAGPRREDGRW